ARKQEFDRRSVVKLCRDHERSAAAIVLIVDMCPAIEEQLYLLAYVVDAGFLRMARDPHQRSEVVAIAGIDIDAVIEKEAYHRREAPPCSIDDRSLARGVDRLGVCALLHQKLHDGDAAHIGGRRQRRDAVAAGKANICAMLDQELDDGK